jgi:hypothetical protein
VTETDFYGGDSSGSRGSWCAYVENTARGWGIKDRWDEPYRNFVGPVNGVNKRVYERV